MTQDGRGFGRSVGEGEERLQTEWAPHHVGAGCGHRVSFGILPEDTAPHRAGQSVSSPSTRCDVTLALGDDLRPDTEPLPSTVLLLPHCSCLI